MPVYLVAIACQIISNKIIFQLAIYQSIVYSLQNIIPAAIVFRKISLYKKRVLIQLEHNTDLNKKKPLNFNLKATSFATLLNKLKKCNKFLCTWIIVFTHLLSVHFPSTGAVNDPSKHNKAFKLVHQWQYIRWFVHVLIKLHCQKLCKSLLWLWVFAFWTFCFWVAFLPPCTNLAL